MKYYFFAFAERLPYSVDSTVLCGTMLQISAACDVAYMRILENSCIS